MAAFDLEEQERLDALKDWWKQNGPVVYVALAVFIIAVAGIKGWRYYHDTRADAAAEAFAELEKNVSGGDAKKLPEGARQLMDKYPESPYAARAALAAAQASFDAKDSEGAQKNLRWVIDNSKLSQFQSIARLRLAAVLFDSKKYDDALKVLDENKDTAFLPLTADLRGDILAAQGKTAEARAAYKLSLEKIQANNPLRQITQMKLDALGDGQ
jgi:predicted negative regulator of RcsB-dependent stress response